MIRRISVSLPRLGMASLVVCLFSGLVLSVYYRPFGEVFRNIEEITSLVPFGWFFRQLHFVSGQCFVMLMSAHTLEHFLKRRYRTYPWADWSRLLLSIALCFFALFTGFVLKGDLEGRFAGKIFMNLLGEIPLLGQSISGFFVRPGNEFFFLPFIHHCLFVPAFLLYLTRHHIREWFPGPRFLGVACIGLFLYAIFVPSAPDILPGSREESIEGPWFFLGIQTLLRHLPPLWAGVVIPAGLFTAFLILPRVTSGARSAIHCLLTGALCAYAALTIRALLWGP